MSEHEPPPPDGLDEAMTEMLVNRLVQDAVAELDLPHVVICTHVETGITSYQGPYPDALTAAVAAEQDHATSSGVAGEGELIATIAPLAPLALVEPTEDAGHEP